MKRLLIFFLLIPLLLKADFDQLFPHDDPSLVHHVSVISGHLNLSWQDIVVQGAVPLTLPRSYSSSGALSKGKDSFVQNIREGWMPMGGWDLCSYTNMMVETLPHDLTKNRIYISERNGTPLLYVYRNRETGSKHTHIFTPSHHLSRAAGYLSARTQPGNNALAFAIDGQYQILATPDGGIKYYLGRKLRDYGSHKSYYERPYFYQLHSEILPSGHIIDYEYRDRNRHDLIGIKVRSPNNKNKVFASIAFESQCQGPVLKNLLVKASDGKTINYSTACFDRDYYINHVTSNFRAEEEYHYAHEREGIGARVVDINISAQEKMRVTYFKPPNKEASDRWAKHPQEKPFEIDKVSKIEAPVGSDGQMVVVASFTYAPNLTVVIDATGIMTKYHHDGNRLIKVEYFDSKGQRHSSQRFYWEGSNLVCKALLNAEDQPVFAKTFGYDDKGNLSGEGIWGSLTGHETTPLVISESGRVSGAENYHKVYAYLPKFNVVTYEAEDNGLSYRYTYLANTDLLTSKLTCYQDKIVLRSFCSYDSDHLLVSEIVDDGSSPDENNLVHVNVRSIKRYERDPVSGLVVTINELYLDKEFHTEKLARKTKLTYSEQKQVIKEDVYDEDDVYRYSLHTTYDMAGRVLSKTTPTGQINSYTYDSFGQLQSSKEVGSALKHFSYDAAGRNHEYEIANKIYRTTFDVKGNAISETDSKGNIIRHIYDDFAHPVKTSFPQAKHEQGSAYIPEVNFDYDIQGNLVTLTLPQGETTKTWYNVWQKPTRIVNADQSEIRHYYTPNGLLLQTLQEDGSYINYTYNCFQQPIAKKLYSSSGCLLISEEWSYEGFNLHSYKDPRGLITLYGYNSHGQKTWEKAIDRETHFEYDSLGQLKKISKGENSHYEIKDVAGRIISQWDEDLDGHKENYMCFFYDSENRKVSATRNTSKGDAYDYFFYDSENRLIKHIDPLEAETRFCYEIIANDLHQYVEQKISIDPLGNQKKELYDVGDRLIETCKYSLEGQLSYREQLFYNRSGQLGKRISTALFDSQQLRDTTITWQRDALGRIIEEKENGQKTSSYTYDSRGRLKTKTWPNQVQVFYVYDEAGRLVSVKSSDNSVNSEYRYQSLDPIESINHLTGQTWLYSYNLHGELIEEKAPHSCLKWDYDNLGRKKSFILPDQSAICFKYAGLHLQEVSRHSSQNEMLYKHSYIAFDSNGHVEKEALIFNLGFINTDHDLLERAFSVQSPWHSHAVKFGISGLVTKTENSLFEDKEYSYDSLNQLTKEGQRDYQFDSLGNPTDCEINAYNQILKSSSGDFVYDANGCPISRTIDDQRISYCYDALGRLTEITYDAQKRIRYIYDPNSRIFSKIILYYDQGNWQPSETSYFIHDQQTEVGCMDNQGRIKQLKVTGLGIKSDVGAAIAVELEQKAYLPLHDLAGNIIALVGQEGDLLESYDMSAFGQEESALLPLCPWRFSSKRCDEGLIYFGFRFYDPSICRWLTPDPAGYIDGANVYAYVSNSPLNRLDLFGLFGSDLQDFDKVNGHINQLIVRIADIPRSPGIYIIPALAYLGEQIVDGLTSCGHFHLINFTPQELQNGYCDIFEHFTELVDKTGSTISLITPSNGVGGTYENFYLNFRDVSSKADGTLCIGIHNKTQDVVGDVIRAGCEFVGVNTPIVDANREFMNTILTKLASINRNTGWLMVPHSEGNIIFKRANEGLPAESRQLAQSMLYVIGVAPGEPIPKKDYAAEAINICSKRDWFTGWFAPPSILSRGPNFCYNFTWLEPLTNPRERDITTEHGFLNPTLRQGWVRELNKIKNSKGFYEAPIFDSQNR